MRRTSELLLLCLLAALLAAIDFFLGRRVAFLAGTLAAIWFAISMVLLTRPPGIPEFASEKPGGDEQYVIRRDVLPKLPWSQRVQLSLTLACGMCLLIWLSLTLLG